MTKVAINGLGRMGKLVLRALIDEGLQGEIVLLNDPAGTPEQHALLMEFDTVHGRWAHDFASRRWAWAFKKKVLQEESIGIL